MWWIDGYKQCITWILGLYACHEQRITSISLPSKCFERIGAVIHVLFCMVSAEKDISLRLTVFGGAHGSMLHERWWLRLGEIQDIGERHRHLDLWSTTKETRVREKVAQCESLHAQIAVLSWFPMLCLRGYEMLCATEIRLRDARCVSLKSRWMVSKDVGSTKRWRFLSRFPPWNLVDARQHRQRNGGLLRICPLGQARWTQSGSWHETRPPELSEIFLLRFVKVQPWFSCVDVHWIPLGYPMLSNVIHVI